MVAPMKPRYTVEAERSGGWWAISVIEIPGVFSQVRTLSGVEHMAREAIGLMLEVAPDSFDIVVREALEPSTEESIRAAQAARREAAASQGVASAALRHAARTLSQQGLPQRDIGRLLDLSHQRVAQLLAEPRKRATSPSE